MTDLPLPRKQTLRFSLALRILLLCGGLVVIPLLFHGFIIHRESIHLKRDRVVTLLETVGAAQSRWIQEDITDAREKLQLIGLLSGISLDTIARLEGFAALYWGEGPCAPNETICLFTDPKTRAKQFVISEKISGKGTLTLHLPEAYFLYHLPHLPFPYFLTILDEKGNVFVSEHQPFVSKEVSLISAENMQEEWEEAPYYGMQFPIPGVAFQLLVDVPKESLEDLPEAIPVLSTLASLLWLIILIGGGVTAWLTYRMSRPLKALCLDMQRLGEGDLSVRYASDRMGFEINSLGDSFNQMVSSLIDHMQRVKVLATELKIGEEIQRSLLPKTVPHVSGLDIGTTFIPAKEVGGDFYDLFLRNNQLVCVVADASGKGISACLYSLIIRSMLRSYGASHEELAEIIRLTNNLFCLDTGESGMFVTAWIGIYDPATRELLFASAGHLPALLRRHNGSIEELNTSGLALGVMPMEKSLVSSSVRLASGDTLLLYTDGVTEAHDAQMRLYGKERLMKMLETQGSENVQEFIDRLVADVKAFSGEAPQHDDLTALAIHLT